MIILKLTDEEAEDLATVLNHTGIIGSRGAASTFSILQQLRKLDVRGSLAVTVLKTMEIYFGKESS